MIESLTLQCRGKAEHVIAALFVLKAIASEAGPIVGATTRSSGVDNGILHRAISQPASIAPVQAGPPGIIELIVGCNFCALFHTCPHSIDKTEVVAATFVGVWENNT